MSALAHRARRRRGLLAVLLALLGAGVLQLAGANPATSQSTTISARRVDEGPDLDPGASVWRRAPQVEVPLTAQQTSYPFGSGGVAAVRVKALHDGERLYVRLEWEDTFEDDNTREAGRFSDAAAVQFPGDAAASVPAICMGQADGGVNIWHWRADSQAGLPNEATDLHGDAVNDLPLDDETYPDDLDYPARRAGNPYSQPEAGAVQNLSAVGFGTIGLLPEQPVEGRGEHDDGRWAVVFARDLGSAGDGQPTLAEGATTDVAFAVWDGHNGDRNGQKSVSQFTKLDVSGESVPGGFNALWLLSVPLVVGGFGVVIVRAGRRRETAGIEA